MPVLFLIVLMPQTYAVAQCLVRQMDVISRLARALRQQLMPHGELGPRGPRGMIPVLLLAMLHVFELNHKLEVVFVMQEMDAEQLLVHPLRPRWVALIRNLIHKILRATPVKEHVQLMFVTTV